MSDANRPPLWREIDDAWWSLVDLKEPCNPPPNDQAACVIRAVRDWLVPEEAEPELVYRFEQRHIIWQHNQRLRALLTTEADRAERGDG